MIVVTPRSDQPVPDRPERPNAGGWTVGPLGQKLTQATLPPRSTRRWTSVQKAEVVSGVAGDLLSMDEALDRYGLTAEEFEGWKLSMGNFGMDGLRCTHTKRYRALAAREIRLAQSESLDGMHDRHGDEGR